jgi:hypothetical protein
MLLEQSRKYIAEIACAFFLVSLISTIWESSDLVLNRPMQPDYTAGLVYPFKVKGPVAYISASEANRVSLCALFCILSFGCIAYAFGPIRRTADVTLHRSDSHSFGIVFLISIAVAAGSFSYLVDG